MFISLNKKILYSLFIFTVLLIVVFFAIFINFYSQKMQDNRDSVYLRNQYVVNLLTDNIYLQSLVSEISQQHPELFTDRYYEVSGEKINVAQRELTNEQNLNEELRKNYNNNQEAIIVGAKIVLISLFVVLLLILLLLAFLDRWVIRPLTQLIYISNDVSSGIFSGRLPVKSKHSLQDEFDILYKTFNQMLDNIENNIEETKVREKFLQQLIDALPDGIRVIDLQCNVVMANASFYKLLKIKDSCVGQKCYKAYGYGSNGCPQSHYNCPLKHLKENITEFHAIHEVEKTPLYVNAAKLSLGKKESPYGIIESFHDLSQDVRYSHQQKVSSLAFLSTSLAHEMKNNLGAIRLIMEGILSDTKELNKLNADYKKYLQMAYKQLVEAIQTPERLLKLAQYSDTETDKVNVALSVRDVMLLTDYEAKRNGIECSDKIDPDLTFVGSETDFKMILLNLVQNALKAMPEGGKLTVTGERNKNSILLKIADTGVGIPANKIRRIFEPFYSANNVVKSSGLGLAIVKSLVEKAQGRISVKSKVGKGTEFTIKLPLQRKTGKKS